MTTNSPKQNTHAPQRRQHAEAGDTGWQMPNTGRAEAPTQRNHTIEEDKLHRSSRSPNTEKSNIRTRQNTRGEPKPQPHTHRTGQKTRGGPKPHHTENPKYQPHGKHKNRPTRKGEEERKTKRKNKKAKESIGTKKGEKKRRRRPAGPGKKRKLKHGCMDQSQQWYR